MTRLIDADKLKKVIHCEYSDDLGILEKIDNAPTVEPERPHGEWITTLNGFHTCSKCDEYGNPNYFKFCPYCGADMRKGGENE